MATLSFSRSRKFVAWGIVIVGFAVLPLVVGDSIIFLTTDFLAMALFAMGYNLLFGLTGLLSFGHGAYFGLGAYTVALLYDKLSVGLVYGIFLAPVVAALFAAIIGSFCVRSTGMLFGMLTMAFAQLVYVIVYGWYSFTGGDNGLLFTPPDYLLPAANYYYFTLLFVAVSLGIIRMITVSSFGAALVAIRENPERAAFSGINVRAYQLAVFILSGAFVGVAGALRAPLQQMATPSMLHWAQSADPLLMALTGGFLTFTGPHRWGRHICVFELHSHCALWVPDACLRDSGAPGGTVLARGGRRIY